MTDMLRIVIAACCFCSTGASACEVNGQTAKRDCEVTQVIPQTAFTQDLAVREATDAYGVFDRVTVYAGSELTLYGTVRWTVKVEPDARLILRGMAQIVENRGGEVVIRGMVDQVNAQAGRTVIAGTVGRVTGSGDIRIRHGAVVGGRIESRGQPGSLHRWRN